ncbi:MAG: hypothetical protein NZM00_13460 [Anaerolinea sp.]|nr:hypothetical protein [Anaerolinea sp.]
MGEYWRYFFTDGVVTLADLEQGFRTLSEQFWFEPFSERFWLAPDQASENVADLMYGDDIYAEIEINTAQGDLFRDDVDMLREQLANASPDDRAAVERIEAIFASARGMIALRPTDFGIVYLDRIKPIWDWVMARWPGMLQVDDDGYYDRDGAILTFSFDDDDATVPD